MAKATRGSKTHYKENKNMKYFLGSVGSVEAFRRKENGSYELAFVSKTLTDSGINTTISKEDIRGGTGAPIQFSFYHDPAVEITLTDVVFKREYLEAQLGVQFTGENAHDYYSDECKVKTAGDLELTYEPRSFGFGACGGDVNLIWVTEKGKENWESYTFTKEEAKAKKIHNDKFEKDHTYCVRYCKDNPIAKVANVTSQIIPSEYMLIITAPIFAGDACAASNGKKAGTITYEIPRFRLNGGSEMAFNMSSNQTMSLAGSALAVDDTCEMGEQSLYNIVITLDGEAERAYKELIVDEDCLKVGSTPIVYGLEPNGRVTKLDNSLLKFFKKGSETPALTEGKFAEAGDVDVKFIVKVKEGGKEVEKLVASDVVTVAA